MKSYYKYIDYINKCKGNCTIAAFKEDWDPIGQMVLDEMLKLEYVYITNDGKVDVL